MDRQDEQDVGVVLHSEGTPGPHGRKVVERECQRAVKWKEMLDRQADQDIGVPR
jgi:hypothetical protein